MAIAAAEIVDAFGRRYLSLLAAYNIAVKTGDAKGAPPDPAAFTAQRDALVQAARTAFGQALGPAVLGRLDDHVQREKRYMNRASAGPVDRSAATQDARLRPAAYFQGKGGGSCGSWMNPGYDTYASQSTDGTYLYTSVLLDGTTSGTCPPGCECSGVTHQPYVYNSLHGTGGWLVGSSVPWNGYISTENDQSIPLTDGTEYQFTSESEVECSASGLLYSAELPLRFLAVFAEYGYPANGYQDVGQTRFCNEMPACTNPPPYACGEKGWTDIEIAGIPCAPLIKAYFVAVRLSETDPWDCTVGPSDPAGAPGHCD